MMDSNKQIGTIPGLIIAGLVIWGMVKLMGGVPDVSGSDANAQASSQADKPAAAAPKPVTQSWHYQSDTDPMTGKTTRFAMLRSDNAFALDFPYRGAQHATLSLRHHPRHGFDSIISIERGQLQCGISRGCKLQVRFDDGSPQRWTFVEPESHDSTALFLRDGRQFARKVLASKRIRIELKFFSQSPEIVEFHTDGLDRSKIRL